jgi:N-acetyl-alpha-D-muramate 1-phosphate uridylyltransferase
MDIFILAAGRGERLRPLTDEIPKPLIKVGKYSLLEHHLIAIAHAGFTRVVVNHAWLGDKIVAAIGDGSRFGLSVSFIPEPPGALETAGAIINALEQIQTDRFLIINSDIRTDFNFANLQLPEDADIYLITTPNPAHNPDGDFTLSGSRLERAKPAMQTVTYSGIGCYRKRLFEDLKPGRRPLLPIIHNCIDRQRARGALYEGQWIDVGTQERLEQATLLERTRKG